jgi:glucose/arabinose dehydrogenase
MNRISFAIFLLAAGLLVGCGGDATMPEPTAVANGDLPGPVVTLMATNTFIPYTEAQPSPTASATPTLTPTATPSATPTPTPTPLSPAAGIALLPIISEGLERPTFLTHAFDERLFVTEQVGRIRIIENGQLLPAPFLDITDRVGATGSEQGLLGLAFHPNYGTPDAPGYGQFYVNYTDKMGDTHISRFSVLLDDPYTADPGSEEWYLRVDQPYPNHNGGMLAFGPDGYLYAGLGDGGSGGDPLNAGQSLTTLLGKILRLDVDTTPDEYAIPPDNPFVDDAEAMPEIWAYGLRNPWRFSFDRLTGDLFIGDVGQNMWEEVSFQPGGSAGGENYGWRIMEGSHCYDGGACSPASRILPIFEYDHSQGCSISGGYVYRGALYPELAGNYFVADYCQGTIWRLFPDGEGWLADLLLDSDLIISSFGEDMHGELYTLNYGLGGVYQVIPAAAAPADSVTPTPTPTATP